MSNRVVITGVGTINPLGNNVKDYISGIKNSECGIDHISFFDTEGYSTRIAAEVKSPDFSHIMDSKEIRRTSRFIIFALKAAMEALKDSGLEITESNANHIGVEIGSGIGGIEVLEQTTRTLIDKGPSKVSPFTVPKMMVNASVHVFLKLLMSLTTN